MLEMFVEEIQRLLCFIFREKYFPLLINWISVSFRWSLLCLCWKIRPSWPETLLQHSLQSTH